MIQHKILNRGVQKIYNWYVTSYVVKKVFFFLKQFLGAFFGESLNFICLVSAFDGAWKESGRRKEGIHRTSLGKEKVGSS